MFFYQVDLKGRRGGLSDHRDTVVLLPVISSFASLILQQQP